MVHGDGHLSVAGEIFEAKPPRRLVIRRCRESQSELKAEGESLYTIDLEPSGTGVQLPRTNVIEREPSKLVAAVSGGWAKIISNLKSLRETGAIAMQDAYPPSNRSQVLRYS